MRKIKKKKQKQQARQQLHPALIVGSIVALVAVVTLVVILASPNPFAPETDFTVYTASGEKVQLSDFAGKPIVLNFWTSWCGPCQAEMPDFQKAYEQYGDKVQFVMVNLTYSGSETKEKAQAILKEKGYTFPVFFDTDADAGKAYNVESIPATFFFDKNGNIVDSYRQMIDEDTLLKAIKKIL